MVNRAKSLSHIGKRSVLLSVIALFEIAALVVVACFSWIEHGPAELDANNFVIRSGSGFNFFNEDGDAVDVLPIKASGQLSDCSTTAEARRLYFPILGEANGSNSNIAKDGSELMYRAATEVDRQYYITVDFQVISVSTNDIEVFVDPRSSYIRYKDDNLLYAARITFNSNDNNVPVTVCPGDKDRSNKYLVPVGEYGAVKPISDGVANKEYPAMNKGVEVVDGKYVYKNGYPNIKDNPTVFTLPKNKVKTITMTVWLDGFDENCVDDLINIDETEMQIRFDVRAANSQSQT